MNWRAIHCLLWLAAGLLLSSGCTANHYRRAADKESYKIIQKAEKKLFGHTNQFTIDTPYSQRKPNDIKPEELMQDRLKTNRLALSIEESIGLAIKNSRDYQTAKETLFKAALSLSDARYKYSPIFQSGGSAKDKNDTLSLSSENKVSISRLLQTGGTVSASLANSMIRYYTGDPNRSVVNVLTVDLVQPLLRGFGQNSQAIETLKLAERNVIYNVRTYGFYQQQFALGIANSYFRLLQQKDTIRNSYTNYLRRVDSTKRLEARAKDREAVSQVDQARQAELTAKNSYVDSVARYRNDLDRFKITLGIPLGEEVYLDDRELDELEQTGLLPTPLDTESAFRLAVQRKLPILNEIDQFEDSKRQVRIAKDQLRTQLNAVASANYQWSQTQDYSQFNADKIDWSVGLDLNLPLDRLQERNSYRRALIAFQAQIRGLTLTLDNLKDSIDRGVRTLEQRRQNYLIEKNALDLANRRVESTTLLLRAGRIEVRDLNDALDSQIATQNALTVALVNYQETRLQLMLDIGALNTDLSKFWLKDHLAAFFPGGAPVAAQPAATEQAITDPETLFQKNP